MTGMKRKAAIAAIPPLATAKGSAKNPTPSMKLIMLSAAFHTEARPGDTLINGVPSSLSSLSEVKST